MNQLESRRIATDMLTKIFNLSPTQGEIAFNLFDTLYLKRNEGLTVTSLQDVESRLDLLEQNNLNQLSVINSLVSQVNSLSTSTNNVGPQLVSINNILTNHSVDITSLQTSVANLSTNQTTINTNVSNLTNTVSNLSTALTNQALFNAAEYGYTAYRSSVGGVQTQSLINFYPDMATFSGGNANIQAGTQFLDGVNRASWINVKEGVYTITFNTLIVNAGGTFFFQVLNSNSNNFVTNPINWDDDTHSFTVSLYLNAGNNMVFRMVTSSAVSRTMTTSNLSMTKV